MTVPTAAEAHIRALAANLRRLAGEMNAGRHVDAELDAAAAELADELDRYNLLGELTLDDDRRHDAAGVTT